MTGQNRILRFDRTPVARLISCAATFASAALVFDYMSHGAKEIEPLTMTGLVLLFLCTLAAAVVQYGDHIYFSDVGVMYENRVLSWLGRAGRRLPWGDNVGIREIKGENLGVPSAGGPPG